MVLTVIIFLWSCRCVLLCGIAIRTGTNVIGHRYHREFGMKALYIIAWVCLVLSIIVHVLSILGPEDVLSDVDAFVWLLHGGAILLGLPVVMCAQKLIIGTQEKDSWKAVLKNCPYWMRGMVVFFVVYGIGNFIVFMRSGAATHSGDTPASIFKGFSGHWMIFYSIEVAIFYSYLKQKLSGAPKNFLGGQVVPMDADSRQQYDADVGRHQIKWNKYRRIIVIFLIVGSIFLILLWLAFRGYPWFLGYILLSLFPFAVAHVIYMLYSTWRADVYLQRNHFKIWKKGKSSSLADRVESQRLVKELDDPYLKSLNVKARRFSTICFWVWLIVVGVIVTSLILLQ